jgi:CBS domain-containing protein
MKRNVATLRVTATLLEAVHLMKESCCGLIPVCNADGAVVGVITDRDVVVRACVSGVALDTTPVAAVMTSRLVSCRSDEPISRAEQLMAQHKVWRVLVIDDGRLVGLVSLTDIAQSEEPLLVARVLRHVTSREYRVE